VTERISQFSNDGLIFDVVDSGPIDGDVVVLLHGFPQTARSWSAVSEQLHAKGFRTLTPNQRGYAAGARPGGRKQYTIAKLVGDIAALIDNVGRPVHLVGHDWGAAVAWATAAARPELVRTLTAVSVPHPGAFLKSMVTGTQAFRSYYMVLFQIPGVGERFARFGMPRSGMPADAIEISRAEVMDGPALTTALNWYRAMLLTSPKAMFKPVTTPTTYVWSDGDIALGRKAAVLTQRYVHAPYRLVVVSGATHWLPDTHPEVLAEAISDRAATG